MPKNIAIVGSGWQAAQSALTLADLGIEVDLLTPSSALDSDSSAKKPGFNYWPLLLRAAVHPRINLITNAKIAHIAGRGGDLKIKYRRTPRFVKEELCTACGECEKVCSVKIDSQTAIHRPVSGVKSVPSAYLIDKEGISPCRSACPLEINVHGYVSLIHQGKTDKALKLINQTAPLAGVLGRLCTHPCETKCSRAEVDKPLFIQALHRYAADMADEIVYARKDSAVRPQKVAVIGSGPAGLTAAWDLARRGYSPTIFEANHIPGGMLASGIPAFRLPSEVRQKEIAAIQKLGVNIKTGVTFGREITLDSLQKEGYQSVFLAIGAHSNNRLNIPGENIPGVVDCIAWLRDFNQQPDCQIDESVVVIGGGNSAVDSARSAKRMCRKDVRILCLTAEMTAVSEEVEEAVKEGIPIDYNVSGLEILGENGRVSGVRCIRVRNVQFDSAGRISLEQIAGSEFVIPADKVIVAIGQRPDSAKMNLKELKLARNQTIVADPLTLETNLPAVFAGGDAVTGSKNVVSAMAAGLRAAESIDRYFQGVPLKNGRTLESKEAVKVDVTQKKGAKYQRAKMPELGLSQRKTGSAETSLGLTETLSERESARCLNCAGCCECLECESVCEIKAVNHQDVLQECEIQAAGVIDLTRTDYDLAQSSAFALKTAIDLKLIPSERKHQTVTISNVVPAKSKPAISVFLCSCGLSNSSVLDFAALTRASERLPGVKKVRTFAQSCTGEGAAQIKAALAEDGTQLAVLAACRCCNWDQVCYSCSDRRVMCRENLNLELPAETPVEYVNIREMGAWLYRDDPTGATRNAQELITAGVMRTAQTATAFEPTAVLPNVLIISRGLVGLSASMLLASQGYAVTLLSTLDAHNLKSQSKEYQAAADKLLKDITTLNIAMRPWPESLVLNGGPGRYDAVIKTGSATENLTAGLVIVDIAGTTQNDLPFLSESNLINRVMKRDQSDSSREYPYSIRDTSGILILNGLNSNQFSDQVTAGEAAAARAMTWLAQESLKPRAGAVLINRSLCRGCGDCTAVCSLIELKKVNEGLCYAAVDPTLCLGCGLCLSVCPTGAIQQSGQKDVDIEVALEAIFSKGQIQ